MASRQPSDSFRRLPQLPDHIIREFVVDRALSEKMEREADELLADFYRLAQEARMSMAIAAGATLGGEDW